jgi:hypothetical protein
MNPVLNVGLEVLPVQNSRNKELLTQLIKNTEAIVSHFQKYVDKYKSELEEYKRQLGEVGGRPIRDCDNE